MIEVGASVAGTDAWSRAVALAGMLAEDAVLLVTVDGRKLRARRTDLPREIVVARVLEAGAARFEVSEEAIRRVR